MDSGVLWNLTSTVLALFIPIAIFLFENEKTVIWDKMVVFDQVIQIKTLSFGLILLTIPILFYQPNSASNEYYRIINYVVFFLYAIGIIISILSIVRCYFWIINKRSKNNSIENSKYRTKCRKRYISNLSKNEKVQKETWSLIWSSVDQQGEIAEFELLDMYIEQCNKNTDYEKKLDFMSIFFTSIDMNEIDKKNMYHFIDYDFYERLSKFLYCEIKCVYLANKNIDIEKVNDFFDIYTKNSIFKWDSRYRYNKFLSQFLEDKEISGEKYRLFLNKNIFKLISYVKKADDLSLGVNIDDCLPDKLIYDENDNDPIKQKIIFPFYLKWLDSVKVSSESKENDKYFANKMFQFIFPNYSSKPFFTLINFMLYVKKHFGYDNLEEMIKAYDKEFYPFKGVNTGYGTHMVPLETVEEVLASYEEKNEKTLELIKNNIKYYDPLLANKKNIHKILNAINNYNVSSPRIDDLKEEILMYKNLF
ncbi:hypothetical protein ACIJDO_002344 [Enterococcus hirae]